MKKLICLVITLLGFLIFPDFFANAQGVGINSTGSSPDQSAGLDVNFTNKGTLITRMTTVQRDAIPAPAEGLQIFNTTTKCFEFYVNGGWLTMTCGCNPPAAAGSISGTATVCQGTSNMVYSVSSITNAIGYAWSLPPGASIVAGANSNSITVNFASNASSGNATVYGTSPSCGNGAISPGYAVTVNAPPTAANAGPDITVPCGGTTATLAANTPSSGTGSWSVLSGTATVTTPSSPTSGVTGLAIAGTATLRWTISNSPCAPSTNDVVITTNTASAGLSIGQSYQGGIIVYILQSGDAGYDPCVQHGIIAAPSDQGFAEWGCVGTAIPGAHGTAIGTGYQNTLAIVAGCGTSGIAAKLCRALTLGGFNDWYLPSFNELNQLYNNRAVLSGLATNYYWSSSEYDSNNAWGQNLYGAGNTGTNGKNFTGGSVRAVRSF